MIVRISLFSAAGTLYSYCESEYYNEEELPLLWREGEEIPNTILGVLEAISQSDNAPPFFFNEGVVKIIMEEETSDSWVAKKFSS